MICYVIKVFFIRFKVLIFALNSSQYETISSHAGHAENTSFAHSLFEPPENRSELDCDDFSNICQPCGLTSENETWSRTQCSIACLDKNYSDRRGKVEFEIVSDHFWFY